MSKDFSLTEPAAQRIIELTKLEGNSNLKLRISVTGGGCSGFQYQFSLDDNQSSRDLAFSLQDATVLIDDISLEFIKGSVLDYIEDLGSASFVIKNPNATAKCGCGSSFSV